MTTLTIIIVLAAVLLTIGLCGWIYYLITKRYFDNEQKRQMLQMKLDEHREALKTVTPLRLQAYERMALFLERISLSSLVMRSFKPGMTTQQLQTSMTASIRNEWEHNLSQQVYLSSEAWSRIREAKDEMINLINATAVNMPADADPSKLAGSLFASTTRNSSPTDSALEYLKKEIKEHFD